MIEKTCNLTCQRIMLILQQLFCAKLSKKKFIVKYEAIMSDLADTASSPPSFKNIFSGTNKQVQNDRISRSLLQLSKQGKYMQCRSASTATCLGRVQANPYELNLSVHKENSWTVFTKLFSLCPLFFSCVTLLIYFNLFVCVIFLSTPQQKFLTGLEDAFIKKIINTCLTLIWAQYVFLYRMAEARHLSVVMQ